MCSATCARIILFIFNFVFFIAGGLVLAIGVWMKFDSNIVNYLHVVNIHQTDPLIDHAGTIFIVVGALVFIIGFLGCCGAIRGSQSMLFLYAVLVVVVMLGEVVAGVLALVFRSKVESSLQESMEKQIREEYSNGTATGKAWDYLQVHLKCCGADSSRDYENSQWWNTTRPKGAMVPVTCCVLNNDDEEKPDPKNLKKCQGDAHNPDKTSEFYHQKDCYTELKNWFDSRSKIFMAIGFVAGGIQIIGLIAACVLRSALKNEEHSRMH